MSRVRIADDFEAIRLRMEELRQGSRQRGGGEAVVEKPTREPDAAAHTPRHIVKRFLADTRRAS
ncbi:MAG TPA: hypothetical protein VM782_19745, partial [Stellaceae bacterium]|nr:hypothetical protein [Stellaceae bacterium]